MLVKLNNIKKYQDINFFLNTSVIDNGWIFLFFINVEDEKTLQLKIRIEGCMDAETNKMFKFNEIRCSIKLHDGSEIETNTSKIILEHKNDGIYATEKNTLITEHAKYFDIVVKMFEYIGIEYKYCFDYYSDIRFSTIIRTLENIFKL